LSAPWLLVVGLVLYHCSPFTVRENRNPQTFTSIILAPIQAIEMKVSIIVSLILDCRDSCGGLVAEDGGGRLFFHCQIVLQFVKNIGNSNFLLFYGLYKPHKRNFE